METKSGVVPIRLDYDRVRCDRCGDAERILAVPCATCGALPRASEINHKVQRRRNLVARIRPLLPSGEARTDGKVRVTPDTAALRRRVTLDYQRLLKVLSESSMLEESFSDGAPLTAAIRCIAETRAELERVKEFRPTLVQARLLKRLNRITLEIAESYLNALEAATPIEAQRHGQAAQCGIDRMATELQEYKEVERAAEALQADGDLTEAVERLFAALRIVNPNRRITELDALGRLRFEAVTQCEAVVGTGVAMLGAELVAGVHLDPRRFNSVLARAASVLMEHRSAFAEVVAEPQVRLGVRRAASLGLEAHAQLARMLPGLPSDEAGLRQLLKLYKSQFEDVMGPVAAILLRATGAATKPYAALIAEDAAELARRMRGNGALADLFAGVRPEYRNAEAHGGSYTLDGEVVAFALRSFVARVPVDEVLDDCFALLESLLALQLAIANQISLLGFEDHLLGDLGYFQPTKAQMVQLLLTDSGADVMRLEFLPTEWIVELRAQPSPVAAVAAGLATQAPSAVSRFVIRNEDGLRVQALEVERSALEEATGVGPDDAVWRNILTLAGCRLDGHDLLEGDVARCAVAAVSIEALKTGQVDRIRRLRRLRELIRGRDDEADSALVDAIRALREDRAAEVLGRPMWKLWLRHGGLPMP